jgi:hypothetical protein
MGKKQGTSDHVTVEVSFGGPAPGTNPKYPPRHVNVAPEWAPYYTEDGGIDVAHFNAQTPQTQFNALRGNPYVLSPIQAQNNSAVTQWLAWADENGGYAGTLPATPLCPAGSKSPLYQPAPK